MELGELTAKGSACNTESTELKVEGNHLRFEFKSLQAKGEKDRQSCSLVLPIEWPKGTALSLKNIRVSGTSKEGRGQIRVELFSHLLPGMPFSVVAQPGEFDETIENSIYQLGCSGNALLRIDSSLLAAHGDITVDTIEAKVSLKNCK